MSNEAELQRLRAANAELMDVLRKLVSALNYRDAVFASGSDEKYRFAVDVVHREQDRAAAVIHQAATGEQQ